MLRDLIFGAPTYERRHSLFRRLSKQCGFIYAKMIRKHRGYPTKMFLTATTLVPGEVPAAASAAALSDPGCVLGGRDGWAYQF